MIATSQCNILQHCWPNIYKLRPNDCNISSQDPNIVGLMLGAFGHLLQHVAICAHARVTHCCLNLANLVPRAHMSFGQHQDIELWNNQISRKDFRSSSFTAHACLGLQHGVLRYLSLWMHSTKAFR